MPFSNEFVEQSFNGGGNPVLTLLEADFGDESFYFVNNTENVESSVSGVNRNYLRGSFSLSLPDQTEDGIPSADLKFGVADIQIARKLRSVNKPIQFYIWLILASNPNDIEYGPVNYQSTAFSISDSDISVTLEVEPILHMSVPTDKFTPNTFRGLFDGL